MSRRKAQYPVKRTMNLFYKPDRTTKPATIALYTLFILVCLLGLSKVLVYDIWQSTKEAKAGLESAEDELSSIMLELTDYDEIKENYNRYASTAEERALVDRIEILNLVEGAVGTVTDMDILSVTGNQVQLRFSGVTLAQAGQIAWAMEQSPIVESTAVNTAATTADMGDLVQVDILIYLTKEESNEETINEP